MRALTSGATAPAAVLDDRLDDNEGQWWRVEADSGRLAALSGGTGTYDLCFTASSGSWTLNRVLD